MLHTNCLSFCQRRGIALTRIKYRKKKDHWHVLATKKYPTDKALEHFDDFYKSIFRLKWPSVRLALLCPQKYVALINNFGDHAETEKLLQNSGAMDLRVLFEVYSKQKAKDSPDEAQYEDRQDSFPIDRVMEEKTKNVEELEVDLLYKKDAENKIYISKSKQNDANESEVAEEPPRNIREAHFDYDRIVYPDERDSGSLFNFIPASKLKGMEDFVAESEYYSYYKPSDDIPFDKEVCFQLNYPHHLKVYSFPKSDISMYPSPKRTSTGVFNYFLLDGASLLPVLVLDVKPQDRILDMCASPGGKSLAILQTMLPKELVANDLSPARVKRIHSVLEQFLYDYDVDNWKDMVAVQSYDGALIDKTDYFDKILVDVPCTNDRHSLHVDDNNIFKNTRIKERLRLPEAQSALLTNALRIVKPGGTVVYSTCSLSPIQNDGVVAMSLRRLMEEQGFKFTVVDLTPALSHTSQFFHFGKDIGLKLGHLVVPNLTCNFGPMYFCKIIKNAT